MKLILKTSVFLFLTLLFISCSQEENDTKDINNFDNTLALNKFKKSLDLTLEKINTKKSTFKTDDDNFISEEEIADDFVNDIYNPSLDLIHSYGVTDQEIIQEFGSLHPSKIALAALAITEAENIIDQGYMIPELEFEDYQTAKLGPMSDTIGGCIADAIGIAAAFEVIESGVMGLGKKGVLKIIRKVGGKYLGPIGIGLAVWDFADCMGWV